MDGKNIYQEKLPNEGIIIMGNEANGISASVEKLVSERIAIPTFWKSSSYRKFKCSNCKPLLF